MCKEATNCVCDFMFWSVVLQFMMLTSENYSETIIQAQ